MTDAACLSDEELLPLSCREPASDTARAHLEACPSCRERLQRLGAELADLRNVCRSFADRGEPFFDAETVSAHPTLDHRERPPLRRPEPVPSAVGRYPVIRLLAVEGQSSVYLGRHPTLDQDVVIKVSHARLGGGGAERDRLVREARLLHALEDQPYLVRVHDLDFDDDQPFLVMDFVRGQNLQQHAERTQYAPREAAALVTKLAHGLAGPHRLGVTHRDLKPKNVLIDPAGEPRIIDFGLALRRDAWTEDAETSGSVSGTVGYMAPEQARGEIARIDARTDVFALGGILYYLLTGRTPFGGETFAEALRRARGCEFDRDALKAADIPPRLAATCLKAMAAEPAGRYRDAEELARELDWWTRPRRPLWPLGVAAACLVLAVTLGLWAVWQPGGPSASTAVLAPPTLTPQYLLQVNGQSLGPLVRPLPLREGDRLKIRCDVPGGLVPALFWLDTDGALEEPAGAELTPAEPFAHLVYPASGQAVTLTRPKASATVLGLVCADGEKPRVEDVRQAWAEATRQARRPSGPLPLLPRDVVFVLDRDGVRPLSHRGDWEKPEQDALAEVEDCLMKFRPLLRRYPFVAGVAVGSVR